MLVPSDHKVMPLVVVVFVSDVVAGIVKVEPVARFVSWAGTVPVPPVPAANVTVYVDGVARAGVELEAKTSPKPTSRVSNAAREDLT